jgi:hypothetical protein
MFSAAALADVVSAKIKTDIACELHELASACECRTSEANRYLPLKERDLDIGRRVILK